MGDRELLGIPEWLALTLWLVVFVSIVSAFAVRNTRRQIGATRARRHNPTRDEFMASMSPDVSCRTAEFLWETAIVYLEPQLAPHPDDDLVKDLPIDEDDWSMDWPRAYAEREGFHESNLPDWPKDWSVTLRNYGRWLDMGPT